MHHLTETDVLGDNIRRMLAAMYAEGGSASCAELAEKYGKNSGHYIMTAVHAAERTSKATGCPITLVPKTCRSTQCLSSQPMAKKMQVNVTRASRLRR